MLPMVFHIHTKAQQQKLPLEQELFWVPGDAGAGMPGMMAPSANLSGDDNSRLLLL